MISLPLCPIQPLAAQDRDEADDRVPGEAPLNEGRLALFLDCNSCDGAYIRREITFVDHVRDREEADVHVLVTDESTGGGGRAYTFHVIGRGPFAGEEYEVAYAAPASATDDQRRIGYVRTLKIVLALFLMRTPAAARISLHFGGELELIHDQLNLPVGGATLEELLLRRRELATSYNLSGSIGFRYRIGSIYNNVVSTRF